MKMKNKDKIDIAINEAAANVGFEGMNLTSSEKQQIKKDLEEKKSLLIAFYELYQKRQGKNKNTRKK